MGINKIQFQKGLSVSEFMENYGTEEKCHAALVASRWPDRLPTVIEKLTVPVATLDVLFNGQEFEKPILVKIDAQGFEDRVICGGKDF